jgi:glycerophosphoryl diester phosphodiesterase
MSAFAFEGPVEIIGHRGFSARAPENTLSAMDAAIAAGADAVEFDLHTAGDGNPVLFHDAMLSRTTNGVGPIRRRTLEQLKKLDAGSWFDAEFAGERVPDLKEALEHIGDRIPRIYAEIKGFREMEDLDRMVCLTAETGQKERTVFIAMNWTLLDRMRSQDPDIKIGFVVDDAETIEDAFARATGDESALIDFRGDHLVNDPSLVERARAAGIEVAVWCIDDVRQATQALDMGVRRITTNEVESMVTWKRSL